MPPRAACRASSALLAAVLLGSSTGFFVRTRHSSPSFETSVTTTTTKGASSFRSRHPAGAASFRRAASDAPRPRTSLASSRPEVAPWGWDASSSSSSAAQPPSTTTTTTGGQHASSPAGETQSPHQGAPVPVPNRPQFSDPVATELALLRVNSLFYAAFRNGDFDALAATLHPDDAVSVVHPGIPPLYGRAAVLQSWRSVMRAPPQIWPSEARVVQIHDNLAWLHCFETLEGARGVKLAATNIYKRDVDGYWRMVLHQAGAC